MQTYIIYTIRGEAEMVQNEKGKEKKTDSYMIVMITQTVVAFVLIVIMLISARSGGNFARMMTEGYEKHMAEELSREDFSEAFARVEEFADVFARTDGSLPEVTETQKNEPESQEEASVFAGGKDLDFTSLDALEGICFDNVDVGFEMSEPLGNYEISSPFGYRIGPISGEPGIHTGLDMAAPYGEKILAAADGTVVDASWDDSYGNYIKIRHDNNTVTIYAHCSSLVADEGDKVSAGDVIAKVGSTGDSTGNHLHFEVRKDNIRINPSYLLFGE